MSQNLQVRGCFSPVAGIQWVETPTCVFVTECGFVGFSPVAGIQWVETIINRGNGREVVQFQSRCRDSVG